jgi:site-specific recombinase XerD
MNNTPLPTLIEAFATYNRAQAHSPRTVSWYTEGLEAFIHYLKDQGREAVLADLTVGVAREWVVHLQTRPNLHDSQRRLSDYTVRGRAAALSAFASFLAEDGYTDGNVLASFTLPKLGKRYLVVLDEEEIDRVLAACNPRTARGLRNLCTVSTFLDSGLRCFELASLRLEDAHLEQGYFLVHGKGNKERVVPIGSKVQRLLLRYITQTRPDPRDPSVTHLFLTETGEPMSVNSVQCLLKRLAQRANVPKLRAHLLRHTYATTFLRNGGDQLTLKEILGHETLAMTAKYVHFTQQDVLRRYRGFSPMDRRPVPGLRLQARRNGTG